MLLRHAQDVVDLLGPAIEEVLQVGRLPLGLLLVGLYIGWILLVAAFRPKSAPAMPADELESFKRDRFKKVLRAFIPPLFLIVAVLGSIFAGIASPTEAAAVGAFGATILTIVRGRFSRKILNAVMQTTTKITCMVFIILVGARAFGLVFIKMGGNETIAHLVESTGLGPTGFLFLVMLVVFIAGFFIDFIEIIFIIVPVVAPILHAMGVDLLWFGILIAMNLQTSFLTPPFGFALFYLRGVAPDSISTRAIYAGVLPFVLIQLLLLVIMWWWPNLVLWLPRLLGR